MLWSAHRIALREMLIISHEAQKVFESERPLVFKCQMQFVKESCVIRHWALSESLILNPLQQSNGLTRVCL